MHVREQEVDGKSLYCPVFFLEPTIALKNDLLRIFPGGPMVRTPCFHCQGHRFNPLWGN